MKKYAPPFNIRMNTSRSFDLWIEKEIEVAGKIRPEFYFGGVVIHAGHVGFYLMSIYIEPAEKEKIPQELLKMLSGKSCFRIKKLDTHLEVQIETALSAAYNFYKRNNWC
ncbi:MAG: hypothetical protein WCM76_10785 [Bacteroidota bacterium]